MEDVATVKKMTVKTTALLLSSSPPFFWVDTLHVLTELRRIVSWISHNLMPPQQLSPNH